MISVRIAEWLRQYLSPLAFALGFVWDNLTLTRIDLLYENAVFVMYLTIAGAAIVLVHAVDSGKVRVAFLRKYRAWLPLFIQFPLGGVFSGFVIFYTKSASVFTSWPFLLMLLFVFVGNEFMKARYEKLIFQVSVYFVAVFSYATFAVPILLGHMGAWVFLVSGLTSLFLIYLFVRAIRAVSRQLVNKTWRLIVIAVGGIYVGFNLLYFTNIIPPVPLSLKEIGIYHNIVRTGEGDYRVTYEAPPWYAPWRDTDAVLGFAGGTAAHCFTSVFAPTRIETQIYHRWLFYDERQGEWVTRDKVAYPIQGGRDGGYRGYTVKRTLDVGKWRCQVETERGQVLGRVGFEVVAARDAELVQEVK